MWTYTFSRNSSFIQYNFLSEASLTFLRKIFPRENFISSEFIIFPEERLHLVQQFLSVASVVSSCQNYIHVEDIQNSSGNKKLLLQKENCFAFFVQHLEPTLVSEARVKLFSLNVFLNLTLFTSRCTPTFTHTTLFIQTRIKHNYFIYFSSLHV